MPTANTDLFSHVLPELVNPRVWPVESRTRPGLIHLVVRSQHPDPTKGQWVWHCTCEATVTDCWHVQEKRALVAREAEAIKVAKGEANARSDEGVASHGIAAEAAEYIYEAPGHYTTEMLADELNVEEDTLAEALQEHGDEGIELRPGWSDDVPFEAGDYWHVRED